MIFKKQLEQDPKKRVGMLGEKAAARYLRRRGYRILCRNFKKPPHELDIVAKDKKGKCLVFVEVKTRTKSDSIYNSFGSAASSVTPSKQRSLVFASQAYLYENRTDLPCRFDVVEVYLSQTEKILEINHIKEAFFA